MITDKNPFEGMSTNEIARTLYKQNETIDEDVNDAIALLGGVDNITALQKLNHIEARKKLNKLSLDSNYWIVSIKDFEKTVFHIEECSLRYVNCRLKVSHVDRECYIETGRGIDTYIEALQHFYGNRN